MADLHMLSLLHRVTDIITRYTQEPITHTGELLEFPVKANRVSSPDIKSSSQIQQVFQLMRQSSAGVKLVTPRSDQCSMNGYLYMKKGMQTSSLYISVYSSV